MTTADDKVILDERARRKRKQGQERDERDCEPDTFDMPIMLPPNDLQAMLREAKEKADAAEERRVQEKVEAWIRQVPTS
jgi:hypothetical protein